MSSNVEYVINNQKDLGVRLKQIRNALKLTQDRLGKRAVINRIESGSNVETNNLFKILHILNYSLVLIPKK